MRWTYDGEVIPMCQSADDGDKCKGPYLNPFLRRHRENTACSYHAVTGQTLKHTQQ